MIKKFIKSKRKNYYSKATTLIEVHLAKGSTPERCTGSVKRKQRSSGLQSGDRIPGFTLVPLAGGGVQIITQIVHTRTTIHHRITVLSQVFRRVCTGVQLVFYVTYVTTVPIILPERPRSPRVGARLPVCIVTRLTVTLVTDTVTPVERLRLVVLQWVLLMVLLVARTMPRSLAVRVTSTGRSTVAATASLIRCLVEKLYSYFQYIYFQLILLNVLFEFLCELI